MLPSKAVLSFLVHRETSAQHFDSVGGEFHPRTGRRTKTCWPMTHNDTPVGWMERAIQRAAKGSGHSLVMTGSNMPPPLDGSHNLTEVVVLPYFNFTSWHHDMHPSANRGGFHDCTHYCSSPYVYYPLWRSLRFAIERQFAR
jgi:hypothetical protein